jgi:hypothetical protein
MKPQLLVIVFLATSTALSAAPDESAVFPDSQPAERGELIGERRLQDSERSSRRRAANTPKPGAVAVEDVFRVEMVAVGERQWSAVRYKPTTGLSWQLREGRWIPIREFRQLRPRRNSRFIVKVDNTATGRFCAIRMDVQSGQSWELDEDVWQPILDETEQPNSQDTER